MADRPPGAHPEARARHVERHMFLDLDQPKNFLPHLSLHEFEACLFASATALPDAVIATPAQAAAFRKICESAPPEELNERPGQSPSKRIARIFGQYNKVMHGATAAKRIGLERIRSACPHFDSWLRELKKMAAQKA